jgi:hypothetical protein
MEQFSYNNEPNFSGTARDPQDLMELDHPTARTDSSQLLPSEESSSFGDAPNVIIFGETGVGKSSLINMIAGSASAAVSSGAIGCTFDSVAYDVELSGRKYRLWDTAGLNEGEHGNISGDRAIENLQKLVQNLQHGGVSLLVYCIRGSRLRDIVKINYDLFYKIVCGAKVPIVIVVTGLENENNMEDWWADNVEDVHDRRMHFAGHACITATRGKVLKNGEHMFEEEYNRSIKLVRDLIVAYSLERSWKPDSSIWLGNIVESMKRMYTESGSGNHGQSDNRARAHNSSVNPQTHYERPRQEPAGHSHTVGECAQYIIEHFLQRVRNLIMSMSTY